MNPYPCYAIAHLLQHVGVDRLCAVFIIPVHRADPVELLNAQLRAEFESDFVESFLRLLRMTRRFTACLVNRVHPRTHLRQLVLRLASPAIQKRKTVLMYSPFENEQHSRLSRRALNIWTFMKQKIPQRRLVQLTRDVVQGHGLDNLVESVHSSIRHRALSNG